MKRSYLRRRTPLRAHWRQDASLWRRAKAEVRERSRGRCEVRSSVCTGRGEQVHHVLPRSAGGANDPGLLLDACGACHAHLHGHPAESYERGWLRHSYGAPVTGECQDGGAS